MTDIAYSCLPFYFPEDSPMLRLVLQTFYLILQGERVLDARYDFAFVTPSNILKIAQCLNAIFILDSLMGITEYSSAWCCLSWNLKIVICHLSRVYTQGCSCIFFIKYDNRCKYFDIPTVVGDNINTTKTTFSFNFNLYLAFKQHKYTYKWKQRESVNLNGFSLITCKLAIRKKACYNNKTFIKKVVFIILILTPTTIYYLL